MVKLEYFKLKLHKDIIVHKPFGLFDFVKLEQLSAMVITDSGTVQEEACIFGVPTIVIRNSTERQELIECGSSVLVGTDDKAILDAYNSMSKRKIKWVVPDDYMIENVSDIAINILLGVD
jgi:UDP-N-acetylglucosamine 2-epimerase (non-hydrolysing)